MAYVALTSLKTTIELHFLLQPIPRVSFPDDQTPLIKSFYDNLSCLQAFLEEKSSGGGAAIKYFGTLIRDFALKVEDDIEIQLSNFVVAKAKDDAASQQLCQIFQQAQQKTADVVEIINSGKAEYRLNDDLTYLKRIIDDHHMKSIQSNATRVVYDRIQTLFKFLIDCLSSARGGFLYTSEHSAAINKDLESKIRDLAVDGIKIQLSSFVLAKDTVYEEEAFQELYQTLQQVEEKRVELVEIINKETERQKTCECFDDLTDLMRRLNPRFSWITPNVLVPDDDDVQAPLESLHNSLFALQEFVLKSKFGGSRAEIQIRHFVLKAKEDIEKQFRNFCVAKEEHRLPKQASQQLFQTLHQVAENAAQLLSTIDNTRNNDEANDTQSVCYPKLEEGTIMVGRQNDVSIIKNKLFSSFKGVKVIPIIGMPGIGKTTLARKILEDQSVALNFEIRGWVTVTQNYNRTKVLRDLLHSISPNHENVKEATLWPQAYECLKEKRDLIVLDDIWNNQFWDELKYLFCNSAMKDGSCILLTTRFYGVAEYACTIKGTYHVMNLLDPNESRELFRTIFPLQRYMAPSFGKFRSHLFHVVEICEGLPLSIVVVAKRLSESKDNIQHELKKIEKEIELLGILDYSALILMYNQLPEYLKGCFLYLGVFPKRSEIQVKILLKLWIAEGFVKPSKNKDLEKIAYCYLKDLIDRSLVLMTKQTFDGKIKTCRVHSVMHNISFREAQKEGILCAVNTRQLPRWSLNAFANSCRWLSLCKHRFDYYVLFRSNNPRSIFFFQENTEIFVSLKLLRVLAFVQFSFLQRLPMQLGDLIFLRYLSVTQWFEGLSDVVSSTVNLQTLIVSCSDSESQVGAPILHLPLTIWEPPQLRHLELDTSYAVNPPSMVKENLQTLSWVVADPTHCRNRVYSNFPNIKILKIFYKVDLEASQISRSSSNCFILDELDYLKRLKSLTVSVSVGCILTFPKRCIFPSQLKKLKLNGTNLSGSDLLVIGTLQWLEVLKLENAFHEKVWEVVEGGFYRLRLLVLKDKRLERLEAYADSFPCLEHLVLRCCECLEDISTSFGEIVCFKSIEMDRFSHRPSIVASARIIQENLKKNYGKENFEIKLESGRQDILSTAIGTDEHCRRIRAMGRGHDFKSLFGHEKCHQSQTPTPEIKQMINVAVAEALANQKIEVQEVLAKQREEFQATLDEMMKQFSSMQTPISQPAQSRREDDICIDVEPHCHSEKASSSDHFIDLPVLGARCQLYLEDPVRRTVAFGTAYKGEKVHGVGLNVDQVRVSVDKIIDPNAKIPFPTDEVQLLGVAMHHFITWPKKLVELCTQVDELKRKSNLTYESVVQQSSVDLALADSTSLSPLCQKAYKIVRSLKQNLVMDMHRGIVGDVEYELHLEKLEIMRFLNMETLDISCLQFFIRGLYNEFGLASKTMYGFLDPHWIQPKLTTRDERTWYINVTMQYGQKRCYLAPYVLDDHWMLMAICPQLNEIYWFDSIGGEPREDIKDIVETCVKSTSMLTGKKPTRQPKWIKCLCAQQVGSTECGYYVMKYMLEILSKEAFGGMDKIVERVGRLNYNQQEIDQVRDVWAKFLIDEWFNTLL